jgi:transposase, IS5 family
MRKRFETQLNLGVTPIEKVKIRERARDELPGILKGLQWIFSTPSVNELIFSLLEERLLKDKEDTGRPGMDLWHVLVLGVLRAGLDADYSRLEDYANHHVLVRQILGLPTHLDDTDELFHYQTLCDNVNLIDEKLLKEINVIVAQEGRKLFKKKGQEGLKVKVDGYVLEGNVHFPTDINLTWDSGRKCLDLIEKLLEKIDLPNWRKLQDWRKRLKLSKLSLERTKKGGGPNKEARLDKAVTHYLEIGYDLEKKIALTLQEIEGLALSPGTLILHLQLEDFHQMFMHHLLLVHMRLVDGEVIDHADKYFSVFERHVEWIQKGKGNNRAEIGHTVLVASDENRLVLDYQTLVKETEKEGLLTQVDNLLVNYAEKLLSLSTDRGFYNKENKELLEQYIEEVCMPKPGKKTQAQQQEESSKSFLSLRKGHSQIESVINALEHHGLNRCLDKGLHGFKRYVGFGVLAYNLHQIGNKIYHLEMKDQVRRKKRRDRDRRRDENLKRAA